MKEALLLVQFLQAAMSLGLNLGPLLQKVSGLIQQRHMQGATFSKEDLRALMDEGDAIEAEALAQFEKTLADPNTPKLD